MKICAIICEFNPFHNGHKYLLDRAREISGCDFLICIMSGSFTQRGEICILDKYVRAKHAVLGGADCVIQLPAAFTVAPAEIFAKGAVKILSSIPDVTALAFGCENPDSDFFKAAQILIDESITFKTVLGEKLAQGESYISGYAAAFAACGGKPELVKNPNNVLALEYSKAILRAKADIEILPVKRLGAEYRDDKLKEDFSSASAIRQNSSHPMVKNNIPDYVYADLADAKNFCKASEDMMRHKLFLTDAQTLSMVYGCGEGLENRLKSLENLNYESIIENATSKRYSSSRIKRILCANLLGLYGRDSERFLNDNLYIKALAVNGNNADGILSALAKSAYPVITGAECGTLIGSAHECFEKDRFEYAVFRHITATAQNSRDHMIIV